MDDLLTLRGILLSAISGQLLPSTADSKALIVQQTANPADHDYGMTLLVSAVAAAFHRL